MRNGGGRPANHAAACEGRGASSRARLTLRCPPPSRCWKATARLAAAPRVRADGAASPSATPDHRVAGELTLGEGWPRKLSRCDGAASWLAPHTNGRREQAVGSQSRSGGLAASGARLAGWASAVRGGRQRRAGVTGLHWLDGVARPAQAQPSRRGAAPSRHWLRGNRRFPTRRANQRRGVQNKERSGTTDRPTRARSAAVSPTVSRPFHTAFTLRPVGGPPTHAQRPTWGTASSPPHAASALRVCVHPRERPVVCLAKV